MDCPGNKRCLYPESVNSEATLSLTAVELTQRPLRSEVTPKPDPLSQHEPMWSSSPSKDEHDEDDDDHRKMEKFSVCNKDQSVALNMTPSDSFIQIQGYVELLPYQHEKL